jgi:hypothetical protein
MPQQAPRDKINKQHAFKQWGSFNSSANREALKETDFFWLENLIQVGPANLQGLAGPSAALATTTSGDNVYAAFEVNLGGTDYLLLFCSNGAGYKFQTANSSLVRFATATFGSSGIRVAQWQNTLALIINGSSYWSYDGGTLNNLSAPFAVTGSITTTVLTVTSTPAGSVISPGDTVTGTGVTAGTVITSYGTGTGGNGTYNVNNSQTVGSESLTITPGSPLGGTNIATYAGRVWITQGRTVFFSAPGSYTDFSTADAGGSFIMSDQTLYSNITALISANNYLYIFGQSSIDILSDVRVASGTTLYTLTNISPNVGTRYPNSVVPYLRSVVFNSERGPYVLAGAYPQKLGPNLDGILPQLDFTTVSTATAQINNQNVVVWAANYFDALINANRYLMIGFFDGKWFLASQFNNLILIVGGVYNNIPRLFAVDNASPSNIYRLFDNTNQGANFKIQTPLWSQEDPTLDKQVMKFGLEATYGSGGISFVNVRLETENQHTDYVISNFTISVWTDAPLTPPGPVSTWLTAGGQVSTWGIAGYAQQYIDVSNFGKYYGFTLTGNSPGFICNGILSEFIYRARW